MIGVQLSEEQSLLHQRLMNLRNKVFAHSDAEMMRMTSQASTMDFDNDVKFVLLQTAFDEGLSFIGDELTRLNELIHVVLGSISAGLHKEAQADPKEFDIRRDYLAK